MSTMTAENIPATAPPPGKKQRFIVSSAEEAVRVIQQRMGAQAKVLSVKQVAGDGLKRFLSSPKLEVVAWIPPETAHASSPRPRNVQQADDNDSSKPDSDFRPNPSTTPIPPMGGNDSAETEKSVSKPIKISSAAAKPSRESQRLRRILDRIGFDDVLLETLSGPGAFERLAQQPIDEAFCELRQTVIQACRREPETTMGNRIAFLGTPGSGKTTSLCKWLTREVLINEKKVEVLRLDVDSPHFGDGLDAFCEAMGVPCHRDRGKVPMMDDGTQLLIDIPGCELKDYRENIKLRRRLDDLGVDTRILVLNAAYENSILNAILRQAHSLEAQRLIFTHTDLLQSWGKLWPFAISRLHPSVLFMGTGPNIASDYNESFTALLIEKTLP